MNSDLGLVCHCVGCSSSECNKCNYSACLRSFESNHLFDYIGHIMYKASVDQVMITYEGCTFKFMKFTRVNKDNE